MPGKLTPVISNTLPGQSSVSTAGAASASGGSSSSGTINYAGMADNTWLRIGPAASTGRPPANIAAYSGFCIDDIHSKILVFGGGHHDYFGNEVWSFDLPNGGWTQLYGPDDTYNMSDAQVLAGVDVPNRPGMWVPTGKPISRHTYTSNVFVTHKGKMYVSGGALWDGAPGTWWKLWGNSGGDTWSFDPATNVWAYQGTKGARVWDATVNDFVFQSTSDPVAPGLGLGCAAYDQTTRKVHSLYGNPSDRSNHIYEYDPDAAWASAWTEIVASSGSMPEMLEASGTLDTKRNAFVFAGGTTTTNHLFRFDLTTRAWANISPTTGTPPAIAAGYGVAYDSVNDVYGVYAPLSGMYVVDATNPTAWVKAADGPSPGAVAQVHGKFKYDTSRNVFVLGYAESATLTVDLWAYRYRKQSVPPLSVPLTVMELSL